jgi:hypothetical protein
MYVTQVLYDTTKAKMDELQRNLDNTENEVNAAYANVKELLSSRFKTIDDLCLTYYEHMGSNKEKEKIYSRVKNIIDGIRSDNQIISSFENIVNAKMDNLITKLKRDCPELKDADRRLYLFIVLGFSSRAISIFQDTKIEVVYNQKSQLKKKLRELENNGHGEYIRYLI